MAKKRGPDKDIGRKFSIDLRYLHHEIWDWALQKSFVVISQISSQNHFLPVHKTSGPRGYPSILRGLFGSARQIHATSKDIKDSYVEKARGKVASVM